MDLRRRAALADAPDEQLSKPWHFSFGEQMISHDSRTLSFHQSCVIGLSDLPVPAPMSRPPDGQRSPR